MVPVTVLIADDEAAIRNGLSEIVRNIDLDVSVVGCAANGRDALTMIRTFQPDIAIVDINMPELDGMEVIRIAAAEKIATDFFILSGYSDFEYAQKAIRCGVKAYFLKPINLLDFRDMFSRQCREILKRRSSNDLISGEAISILLDSSRTLLLNQLIQKKFYRTEDIEEKLKMFHLSIRNTSNCVVVFQLSGREGKDRLDEMEQSLLLKGFGNFSSESWLYADDRILSIINTTDSSSARFRENIYQKIYDLSALGYRVKAGIGSVVEHLGLSGASYTSAVEALSYRIYDADGVLFDSSDYHQKAQSLSAEKIDCKPLIYAMTHHLDRDIAEYVNSFFEVLLADQLPPPNYVIGRCMYLLVNVQKQLALLYPDTEFDLELSYEKFYQFDSVQSLQQWITDALIECSGLLQDASADKNGIIHTAKEYIMNNLDRNIKAKDVADQVHLSESYFSIYFKEKTGTNFRDYILNARISTARRLLKSQDGNISEVAYRVGYGDYRSFSRAFKNETGMTPSEYMNSV